MFVLSLATLHYVTLRYITLHTLHYFTLHYITLVLVCFIARHKVNCFSADLLEFWGVKSV